MAIYIYSHLNLSESWRKPEKHTAKGIVNLSWNEIYVQVSVGSSKNEKNPRDDKRAAKEAPSEAIHERHVWCAHSKGT